MQSDSTAAPTAARCHSRRTMLRGASALGLFGMTGMALTACGSSSAGAEVPPPAPAAAGGSAKAFGPAADIPVGGGKIFDEGKIVVTQPTKGTYKAFTAVCTHTGCTVSEVSDGTINCPCHGSQFSITDGSVVNPPAPAPLAAKTVTVTDGVVSVVV